MVWGTGRGGGGGDSGNEGTRGANWVNNGGFGNEKAMYRLKGGGAESSPRGMTTWHNLHEGQEKKRFDDA